MPNKSQSIFLAGAAVGVAAVLASLIPVAGDCLACTLFIVAGLVAAWHYTDRHHLSLSGGQGMGLGALAGIVAGAVQTVLDQLFIGIGIKPSWREEMQDGFGRSGMDPGQMDEMMQWLDSPLAIVGIILIGLLLGALAGGIGGLIGANVFKGEKDLFESGSEPPAADR